MKLITEVIIKLNEQESGQCRFFQAEDMDLFVIECPDKIFLNYAYGNIVNILENNVDLAASVERYLSLLYVHHGLQRCFLEVAITEDETREVYSFDFHPSEFGDELVSEILQEEIVNDDKISKLYEVLPPAILMDDEKKAFRNVLEYARTEPEGEPTLFIEGEKIPADLKTGIIEKNNGIVNLTTCFNPEEWGLQSDRILEFIPEVKKEEEE